MEQWAIAVMGTVIIALIAVVYHNLKESRKEDLKVLREWQQEHFNAIEDKLDKIDGELGTTDTGLRGRTHRNSNAILTHRACLLVIAEKVPGVDVKHWLLGPNSSHRDED